ncbi:TlpA disulfide reductase family protein [soil metagenome]
MLTRRQLLTGALAALAVAPAANGQPAPGHAVRAWRRGKAAPVLDLVDLDDAAWRLADQRGRMVLLNFWAIWCEPCVAEMASLEALSAKGQVGVMGVNYKQTAPAIRRHLALHPVNYPMLRDSSGDAFKAWTDGILPTTVIVDAKGMPRGSVVGEFDWAGPEADRVIASLGATR